MIRAVSALLALAVSASAETVTPNWDTETAAYVAICEARSFAVDPDLLSEAGWARVAARAREIPNGIGRFWRVTAPNGATSHLWGTAHSPNPPISALPALVEAEITAANTVGLEFVAGHTPLGEIYERQSGNGFFQYVPNRLSQELPTRAWTAIKRRFRDFGVSSEDLDFVAPKTVLETMLAHPCSDRLVSAGYPIQDTRVELAAADADIALFALDDDDALEVLVNARDWRRSFLDTLTLYALLAEEPEATVTFDALYLRGRIADMMALEIVLLNARHPSLDPEAIASSADRYLLAHRNRRMLENAHPALMRGDAFLAAGAFHLPGQDGLIALLRKTGFRVERRPLPGEAAPLSGVTEAE